MAVYYVRYDEHQDQWCVIYFVNWDVKVHSTYNTLACARQYAQKLNESIVFQ